jgi:dolichyl-phosphate beta-glucosyltransferase
VDDGSKDGTAELVKSWPDCEEMYLVQYGPNRGKGGAVKAGMDAARGRLCLMVDADGATEVEDFETVLQQMPTATRAGQTHGISVGSRHHLREETRADRLPHRRLLGLLNNFLIRRVLGIGLNDTQCGFKLFTRDSKDLIFGTMHLERWSFDFEIFVLAQRH